MKMIFIGIMKLVPVLCCKLINLCFFLLLFIKGLCSPRVLTLFNTLFIFVIYFRNYCFIRRCYLLPITILFVLLLLFKISLFVLFQSGCYVAESAAKTIWISVVELNRRFLFSHVLYFLFGVWQLDIGMRLSGAFRLKSGRDLHSNKLVSRSKQ